VERLDEPDGRRAARVRLTVDLQFDFRAEPSRCPPLALAAIDLLDREFAVLYPLDVGVDPSRPPWTNPRTVLSRPAVSKAPAVEAVAQMKARRHRLRHPDGPAGLGHLSEAAGRAARGRVRPCTGAGNPWVAELRPGPPSSVVRDHVRAGHDRSWNTSGFYRPVRARRAWCCATLADAYKALRKHGPGRGQDRRAPPTSSSGSASWSARSTPACSTSGSSSATHPARLVAQAETGPPGPSPV